jgi:CDGSH-type Zn-finger protein
VTEPDDVVADYEAALAADDDAFGDSDAVPGSQSASQPSGSSAHADERVTITAYPNGPLLVRGPFEILTPTGEVIPPRRKTVALCRCGLSTLKPFCDGSHKAVGFRTEAEPPVPQPPLT